jgi:hypothetical protein
MVNHEIYLERILQVVPEPIKAAFGENLEYLDAFDASSVATAAGKAPVRRKLTD